MNRCAWIGLLGLCTVAPALAETELRSPLSGKLFYTSAQRGMLIDARNHPTTPSPTQGTRSESAPLSYDGIVRRSDGVATHWINGRPHVGKSSADVRNLKPGQTRAAQKVYEPYQIQRTTPSPATSAIRVPVSPDKETP